ncbi:MAG: HipA domain-containing protein [Legionellaceae bacterium]|nr:HipA domain-containing protein [Legionellaceae bacterium]
MVNQTQTHQSLQALMNGYPIGTLKKTTKNALNFTYAKSWLDTPGARPLSLSLPLLDKPFKTEQVQHFFDNLLPDNSKIRARIQAQFKTKSSHTFNLLKALGKECPGALQLFPGRIPAFHKKIRFEKLTEKDIAKRLRNMQHHPLGMTPSLDTFCFTLSGSKEKAAFLYHEDTWARPRDKTPTSHILKLSHTTGSSLENEWLCLKIAEAFGLPVAHAHLLHFEDIQALAVKRFDRKYAHDKSWLMRLPTEDLCQALGVPAYAKYAKNRGPNIKAIMRFLLGSSNPIHDRDVFYCSQILFWLLAATDGHAKNFSIFIQPEGKYHLTPLYDITSSYPLMAQNQIHPDAIQMAMPLHTKVPLVTWKNVRHHHFLETAKHIHYSVERAEAILDDMLARVDTVIAQVEAHLPLHFPKSVSEPIFEGMRFMKRQLSQPHFKTTSATTHTSA